jgi:hypothetical protein
MFTLIDERKRRKDESASRAASCFNLADETPTRSGGSRMLGFF